MPKTDMTIDDLFKNGNGVLKRHGEVWTYPGAIIDTSGTNLKLPLNYVADSVVRAGLQDGSFVAAVTDTTGRVSAVRRADSNVRTIPAGLTGTAEMGTELPLGSRPEHDAGRAPLTQVEAEKTVIDHMPSRVEGAEQVRPSVAAAPAKVVSDPTKV